MEYCAISPETDDTPHISVRLWDEGDVINLRHTTESVHRHGALAGIQLWYGGAHAPVRETLAISRGPSQMPSETAYQNYCHECDEDDIRELIEMYVDAAKRSEDAGFDYVEVIGSDSSLPTQFLQPMYNKRTDRWGGSFENRARFWLETMAALKRAVGDRVAVGTRIAIDNLLGPAGLELEEGLRFVELVTREGVCDLWDVKISYFMEWGNDAGPSRFFEAGYQTWATKAVKDVTNVPVVGVGRVTSPDDMVRIIPLGRGGPDRRRAAVDCRPVSSPQDPGRQDRGHPGVHRLQHLRLPVQPGGAARLHPERHGDGRIQARLASRDVREGAQSLFGPRRRCRPGRNGVRQGAGRTRL